MSINDEEAIRAEIYASAGGSAHGGDSPITLIAFDGRKLAEGSPLRQQLAKDYPSAQFDVKFMGDTLTLSREDGERFMSKLRRYREEHGVTTGLSL